MAIHPPYPEGYLLEGKVKPITEEQRQALINRIRNIKITGKANRFEISEIAEIALTSLTAEPVAKTDAFCCVWMNDGESSLKPPVSTPLYATPPVPVIQFVEKKELATAYHGALGAFNAGKEAGWNECLAEIKRLNGLGE